MCAPSFGIPFVPAWDLLRKGARMSFRFLACSAVVVVFAVCAVPLFAASASGAPIAIVGGMLIDGNGGPPVHDAVVLIEGNKITGVGTRGSVAIPNGAKIINANGMSVMPGLFDLHVHLL